MHGNMLNWLLPCSSSESGSIRLPFAARVRQSLRHSFGDCAARHGLAIALFVVVLYVGSTPAAAQSTRRVPQDYSTISAAIGAAVNGDTVLVAPGTYTENINFNGKAITVRSEQGPNLTVIDGNGAGSVVTIANGEGASTRLIGFTIRNGAASDGGGIVIRDASPVISENILVSNRADRGSALAVLGGSPLFQRNVVTGHRLPNMGTIYVVGPASAQMLGNVVAGNFSSGFFLNSAGTPTLSGNVVSGNEAQQGGGFRLLNVSDALIVQNLIFGNSASEGGGIHWLVPSGAQGPRVLNNTIAENDLATSSGIYASGFDAQATVVNNIIVAKPAQTAIYCDGAFDSSPAIQYNNIYAPSGPAYGGSCTNVTNTAGNISADPLFADPAQADFRLRANSPSIDAGTNTAVGLPPSDIDGRTRIHDGDGNGAPLVDMGAYEFTATSRPITVAIDGNNLGTFVIGTQPVSRVATISNAGPGAATVIFSTVAGNDPAVFALAPGGPTPCASLSPTLAAGTNCTLMVTFSPLAQGWKRGLLVVMSDAIGSPAIAPINAGVIPTDGLPDDFTFSSQTGVARGSTVVSNTITVSGINIPSPISVLGGDYSIDGGAFTAAAGTVRNGQTVAVRLIASPNYGTIVTASLMIGDTSIAYFHVTTAAHTIDAATYLPLNLGNSWSWRSNGVTSTATVAETLTINGVATSGIRDSSDGSTTYYSSDALGVRMHRLSIPGVFIPNCGDVAEIDTFTPPALVLPATATVGQTYTSSGTVIADVGQCGTYQFGYFLTSIPQAVERISVPAGQFDALKVRLLLSVDGFGSETTVWLAPGIGQVKGLDVNGVADDLVSTNVVRTIPDEFAFAAQSNVPIGTTAISNLVTISGITAPAPISIVGGEYSIDGGQFTSQPGSISPGGSIRVRLMSSASPLTSRSAALTVGGVTVVFQVTTGAGAPSAPTSVTAAAATGAIIVSFSPPANSGGTEITGYSATCTSANGGASGTSTAPANSTSIRVSEVSNGSTYTCTVTASNVAGTSIASAPSNAVMPFNLQFILNIILDD